MDKYTLDISCLVGQDIYINNAGNFQIDEVDGSILHLTFNPNRYFDSVIYDWVKEQRKVLDLALKESGFSEKE